tara:strand:- start:53 stop:1135 length:1083 start_codon:yes stop_codon:yes gene_type:complete
LTVQNKNIQNYLVPELELECGDSLKEVELAYTTYGKLADSRDNAILVFHALTGSHLLSGNYERFNDKNHPWNEELEVGWWNEFVGSGKMIDTDKYFVICVNYLGGCYGSTGPNSINKLTNSIYGDSFPQITFKDIENSQKLVCDKLGVKSLHAVAGASIGGLMALEFSITYPEYVNKIISISSSYKVSTIQLLHNLEQAYILDLAKDSKHREKEYLSLARMIAHKTYISLDLLTKRAKAESKYIDNGMGFFLKTPQESYMMHQGEKFIERFTMESYRTIINAWQNFKIDKKDIKKLKGKEVLVLSIDSDVCFYPEEQTELVEILESNNVCVNYYSLHSDKGHDAFLLEPAIFFEPISSYL